MRHAAALVAALLLSACEEPRSDASNFPLPSNLLEVSGLAAAGPDSVFAHDDEYAIVHEVNVHTGKVVRTFALGNPTIAGDFEGIAAAGNRLYLVTSDGLIYSFAKGADRTRVAYRAHDTGIGPRCETEGLSLAPGGGHLLILCKRLRRGEDERRLEIYRWALDTEHAPSEPWMAIPLDTFLDRQQRAEFAPSGIEWDEAGERLLIVSGRNRLLVELGLDGKVHGVRSLDPARHSHVEGITVLPGCRMALADEGTDTQRARLAVYPCLPTAEPAAEPATEPVPSGTS